jgi:hypothetical protein
MYLRPRVSSRSTRESSLNCRARPGVRSYRSRRFTIRPDESAAHTLPVAEACLLRDVFDGTPALLEQVFRRFQSQRHDRLGGRRASLGSEDTRELSGAEAGGARKVFDLERHAQILFRIGQGRLDAVGIGVEVYLPKSLSVDRNLQILA